MLVSKKHPRNEAAAPLIQHHSGDGECHRALQAAQPKTWILEGRDAGCRMVQREKAQGVTVGGMESVFVEASSVFGITGLPCSVICAPVSSWESL